MPLESSRVCLRPVGHRPRFVQSVKETRNIISEAGLKNSRILLEKILKFVSRKSDVTQLLIIGIMGSSHILIAMVPFFDMLIELKRENVYNSQRIF